MKRTEDLPRALRRIGTFWWVWIVLGQMGTITVDGRTPWPAKLIPVGLGIWGIVVLTDLSKALPSPWSHRMRWITALAATTLAVEVVTTFVSDLRGFASGVGSLGVLLAFAGYVLILANFSASLPEAQDLVTTWRTATRWLATILVALAAAAVFAGFASAFHQTHGMTMWSIGMGIGVMGVLIASIGALLMTARATMLLRSGFEARYSF